MSRVARRRLLGRGEATDAKGWYEMKWIFFAYGLFIIATVFPYLHVGPWGLGIRLGNAENGMSFNQIGFWLLLAAGSIIILAQVIGQIIIVIARVRAHHF